MAVVTREIGDIASLVEAARKTCDGFGKTAYWYRGHASSDWTLVPSVHRDYDNDGERNLTVRFRLLAPTRHSRCPGYRDMASWLTLMQHYGLPTRLLDWTGSLLAAAFFAVSYDPLPGASAIWVLAPSELNNASSQKSASTFTLPDPGLRSLLRPAFQAEKVVDDVVAALGQDLDLRMSAQLGAYTVHGTDLPLEERAGAGKYLARFLIPEDAKPKLDEELWALGVRRSVLFPDLANLAAELRTDLRLIPRKIVTT